jgi:CheY-like chemotaxis protein
LAPVPEAVPEQPVPPTVAAKGRRPQVMVIDDDTLVSRMLVRALGEYDVTVYDDGQSGLQALLGGGEPPEVIICDLMMPGLSGAEFHERITVERPALLDRLVFFTGGAFSSWAETFLRRPNVRVMHKPVTVRTLRETVASIVKR